MFEPGRKALLQDGSVLPALQELAQTGLTQQARDFAEAALVALENKELQVDAKGQKHVMLSCECSSHAVA